MKEAALSLGHMQYCISMPSCLGWANRLKFRKKDMVAIQVIWRRPLIANLVHHTCLFPMQGTIKSWKKKDQVQSRKERLL